MNIFKKEEEIKPDAALYFKPFIGVEVTLKNNRKILFNGANDYFFNEEGLFIYVDDDSVGFVKDEDYTAVKIVRG